MNISEVARLSGLPASALRHYEQKGLIRSMGRNGLQRVFGPDIMERLALIALGKAAGLSLDEIARMFTTKGNPAIDRQLLARKAKEIDNRIRQMTAMRDGLQHAAACPHRSHMECPRFRRLLGLAAGGRIGGEGTRLRRRKTPTRGRR